MYRLDISPLNSKILYRQRNINIKLYTPFLEYISNNFTNLSIWKYNFSSILKFPF